MAWKKNFRKIPYKIHSKLESLSSAELVVGCVKTFSNEDIVSGMLSHLDIYIDSDGLHYPESIFPKPDQGKHSSWNINGRIIKRTDLPKETYYNYVEAPNWGNSDYGTHTVALPGERYPRDFIAPKNTQITIESLNQEPNQSNYIIKFQLSEVLNRDDDNFEERLFDCINLLQENVGCCNLVNADVTIRDYIQTLNLSWEILPLGTVDEALERIFRGHNPSQQEKDTATERHTFFMGLDPRKLIYGRSGLQRYFGALIKDDLVIFENVRYGNAIYIMFENWEELSQKSRIELLSGTHGSGFERIIHKGDWKTQVNGILNANR